MNAVVPTRPANLPPHVLLVRRVAFVVLGVAEAVLIAGPRTWRLVQPVPSRLSAAFDAGDWIALAAVAAACVGFAWARRSAIASERSAATARDALAIAQRATAAAEVSARAAEKSADADSRMVVLAEEQHHKGLEPKWLVEAEEPSRGGFAVALRYEDGPNEISVGVTLNGTVWEQPTSTGMSEGHVFFHTSERPRMRRGESLEVLPKLRDGLDLLRAVVVVSIVAIEVPASEHTKPRPPWHFMKACDSPHRRVTRVRKIDFRR